MRFGCLLLVCEGLVFIIIDVIMGVSNLVISNENNIVIEVD